MPDPEGNDELTRAASPVGVSVSPTESGTTRAIGDADQQPDHGPERNLGPGSQVGRFHVLEPIGAGGAGLVVSAYDPTLDRKVALKFLKGRSASSEQGREDLVREAKAAARLSHPNVITVYDVGILGEDVFVAMEFVPGSNLDAWRRAGPRSTEEILDVYLRAGRGLIAAHAAGLVHRDFKPQNVLLGDDGRVRVVDFGLAAPPSVANETDDDEVSPDSRETVAGTPAYMAPEQHRGGAVTARTDQFCFCASLYESLYGVRPFDPGPGASMGTWARAKEEEDLSVPPTDTRVPKSLHRVLARGLRVDPADRWPSMTVLVGHLARVSTTSRRRRRAALASGIALAAAVAIGFGGRNDPSQMCQSDDRLAGVWDADRSARVRGAFEETGLPLAADTATRVVGALDRYASDWVSMAQEACIASRVRGEQSIALLDKRMLCLERRAHALEAFAEVLEAPDSKTVEKAVGAAQGLPEISRCGDVDAVLNGIPAPQDSATEAQVESLRLRMFRVDALYLAGRNADALARANEVLQDAQAVPYQPVQAEASRRVGTMLAEAGDYEEARDRLEEAAFTALATRHDEVAAEAQIALVSVVGHNLSRLDVGRIWARHAQSTLQRLGQRADLEAALTETRGRMLVTAGEYDEARSLMEEAVALRTRLHGAEHLNTGRAINGLGATLHLLGEHELALDQLKRAHSIYAEIFGPNHPNTGKPLNNMALAHLRLGNLEAAQRAFEGAAKAFEALGSDHPRITAPMVGLAHAAYARGDHTTARDQQARAKAIRERAYGPDHPATIEVSMTLVQYQWATGTTEGARETLERAIAAQTRIGGPEHPIVATGKSQLAAVALAEGNAEEAIRLAQEALASLESPRVRGHALSTLGQAYVELGETRRAREELERALSLCEAQDPNGRDAAQVAYRLARVLWQDPEARVRASDLARRARDIVSGDRIVLPKLRAQIDAWIEAHPRPADDGETP